MRMTRSTVMAAGLFVLAVLAGEAAPIGSDGK